MQQLKKEEKRRQNFQILMFELRYENDMARDEKEARDDIKANN